VAARRARPPPPHRDVLRRAINCELYPDAVKAIAAAGHELGHHGWSHEQWASLSPPAEVGERMARHLGAAGWRALILHPFLMLDDRWRAGVSDLLDTVAELTHERRTWVVPGGAFAAWLRAAPTS
jgi:peptidoglycan/xylan/chitin deacetylase (PgdA/CDA1 family)